MSSKAFTRNIFFWLRQINHDKRLLAIDLCVAVELTGYFNEKDHKGRAWPSAKTLGNAIGVHEVTVLRSARRLQVAGHLHVVWGQQGSGHTNQYWMRLKLADEQVSRPAAAQVKKPAAVSKKPAWAQENHSKNHCSEDKSLRDLSSQGERDDPSGLGFPSFGAAAPDGAAPEETKEESSSSPTKTALPSEPIGPKEGATDQRGAGPPAPAKISPPSEPRCRREDNRGNGAAPAWNPAWQRLRALWQRGHLSDNTDKAVAIAKAAFAKVMAEGTPADQVLEGAERWVAAADAPRYLPPLPTFLATRAFEQPPPQLRARSALRQQTYHRKPKPDLARMMLALGEED